MTAPVAETTNAPTDPATRLGRAVGVRWRRPGPPVGGSRPAQIGSVAQASRRFVRGIGRPVMVRRALAGPQATATASTLDQSVRPPRWWSDAAVFAAEHDRVEYDFAAPPMIRALRSMPQGTPQRPDGHLASRVAQVVPMQLPAEVRAVGRITGEADTRSRRVPARSQVKAREPGQSAGAGRPPSAPGSSGDQTPEHVPTRTASRDASTAGTPAGHPRSAGASGVRTAPVGVPSPSLGGWASRLLRRRAAVAHRAATVATTPVGPTVANRRAPQGRVAPPGRVAESSAPPQRTTEVPVRRLTDANQPEPPPSVQPAPPAPAQQVISPNPPSETAGTGQRTVRADRSTRGDAPAQPESVSPVPAESPSTRAVPDGAAPMTAPTRRPGLTLSRLWSGVPHRIRRATAGTISGDQVGSASLGGGQMPRATSAGAGPVAVPGLATPAPPSGPFPVPAGATGANGPAHAAGSPVSGRASASPAAASSAPMSPASVSPIRRTTAEAPATASAPPPFAHQHRIDGPAPAAAAAGATPTVPTATRPGPLQVGTFSDRRIGRMRDTMSHRAGELTRAAETSGSSVPLPLATTGTAPGTTPLPLVNHPAPVRRVTTPVPIGAPAPPASRPAPLRDTTPAAESATPRTSAVAPGPADAQAVGSPTIRRATTSRQDSAGVHPDTPGTSDTPAGTDFAASANPGAAVSLGPGGRLDPIRRRQRVLSPRRDVVTGRTPAAGPAPAHHVPAVALGAHRARAGATAAPGQPVDRATTLRRVARGPQWYSGALPGPASGTSAIAGQATGRPATARTAASTLPVAPPRTIVRRADEIGPTTPDLARSASGRPSRAAATTAPSSGTRPPDVPAIIRRRLDSPPSSAPGGTVSAPTSPASAGTSADPSVAGHEQLESAWTAESIAHVVRGVLDAELRDRINGVVDARLASETERRRWRNDRGVF